MQTFVAHLCIMCLYEQRFLRRSRGKAAKALDSSSSTFVVRRLSLRRCVRVARSFGKGSYSLTLPEFASPRTAPTLPKMSCLAYFPTPAEHYESYARGDMIEPTFIASSRKTTCEMGSFFNFKTFSKVYTWPSQPLGSTPQ